MTNETAHALQVAISAESKAQAEVEKLKAICLNRVADALPSKLNEVARKISHDQPEISKNLGKEGISQLQSDLHSEEKVLCADLRNSAGIIKWPQPYSYRDNRNFNTELCNFLRKPCDRLAKVFQKHGYSLGRQDFHKAQELVQAHHLFERDAFEPLRHAFHELAQAKDLVAQAKAKDDKSTIDDLWDSKGLSAVEHPSPILFVM